jgi:hypothetical protein
MFFTINESKKIIFGWSAKCGCSYVLNLFYKLSNIENPSPFYDYNNLNLKTKEEMKEYTIVVFVRNPYKRLVSGFLEKYGKRIFFDKLHKKDGITFTEFVNLLYTRPDKIDKHHFTPQTSEAFNSRTVEDKFSVCKRFEMMDIENIHLEILKEIFAFKESISTISKSIGKKDHSHQHVKDIQSKRLYDLPIKDLLDVKYEISQFYNEDIMKKVQSIYASDFTFFKTQMFCYELFIV